MAENTGNSVYDGVLTRVFYSASTAKILDFFLDHKDYDYPIVEIANNADLSFRTVVKEIQRLEKAGLIVNHRKVGKATMYKLNDKAEEVTLLEKFSLLLSQRSSLYEPDRIEQEVLEPENESEITMSSSQE
jgi:DNA-binding Lrp family transcriptional regulator